MLNVLRMSSTRRQVQFVIITKGQIVFTELLACVPVFIYNRQHVQVECSNCYQKGRNQNNLCSHMLEWFVTHVISFDSARTYDDTVEI